VRKRKVQYYVNKRLLQLGPTSASWIQFALSRPIFLMPILILFFHLRLVISSGLFLSGFELTFCAHFLISHPRYLSRPNRPNTHEEYEVWSSSLCNFLSSVLGINIFYSSQLMCCPQPFYRCVVCLCRCFAGITAEHLLKFANEWCFSAVTLSLLMKLH
jgi:hypothetical protein